MQVGEVLDLVALTFVFLIGLSFCAEPCQEISLPVYDLVQFPFGQNMGRTVAFASGKHVLKGLVRVRSGIREDALEDEHQKDRLSHAVAQFIGAIAAIEWHAEVLV